MPKTLTRRNGAASKTIEPTIRERRPHDEEHAGQDRYGKLIEPGCIIESGNGDVGEVEWIEGDALIYRDLSESERPHGGFSAENAYDVVVTKEAEPATSPPDEINRDAFGVPITVGAVVQTDTRGVDADVVAVTDVRGDQLIGIRIFCPSIDHDQAVSQETVSFTSATCAESVLLFKSIQDIRDEIKPAAAQAGPAQRVLSLMLKLEALHDEFENLPELDEVPEGKAGDHLCKLRGEFKALLASAIAEETLVRAEEVKGAA